MRDAERAELDRERIRLWYVAATRAREPLVLPRLNVDPARTAWLALLDLSLAALPAIDVAHLPVEPAAAQAQPVNLQTREVFQREAAAIAERQHHLVWLAPSRDEGSATLAVQIEEPGIVISADDEPFEANPPITVRGGRERGLVIHKLFEEVITGEIGDDAHTLVERAATLIQSLGQPVVEDPKDGLSPREIADCITRTFAIPEIAKLRPTLLAEFAIYASEDGEEREQITAGVVHAISFGDDGTHQTVVDWKSDVDPHRNW